MEDLSFIFFAFICVVTHMIRTTYEVLKHKKIVTPNRLSFIIIFITMAVLWISWIILCRKDIYTIELSSTIRYAGVLLFVVGFIIFITALFTIKTLETYAGGLMTKGIYSKIRHPMYLGFILWLLGFPLYFGGVISSMMALFFIGNVLFWRYLEEKELVNRFSDYKIYKSRTFF